MASTRGVFDELLDDDLMDITPTVIGGDGGGGGGSGSGRGSSRYLKWNGNSGPQAPRKPRVLGFAFLFLCAFHVIQCIGLLVSIIWTYVVQHPYPVPLSGLIFQIIFFAFKLVLVLGGVVSGLILSVVPVAIFLVLLVSFLGADIFLLASSVLSSANMPFFRGVQEWCGIATAAEALQWTVMDASLVVVTVYLLAFLTRYTMQAARYKKTHRKSTGRK